MLPVQTVGCPYCGEVIELIVDDSTDSHTYVEDCSVCCRPIEVHVGFDADGEICVTVATDTE